MGHVWSDANKFAKWLEVELAATDALAEAGEVPKEAAAAIRARAKIDVARIHELEARVKHDVIAFTMAVGESIGDPAAARWLHYGMTSNDVVDTAQALQIRDASKLIERDLVIFGEVLDLRAHEFRYTPQIGRTHGIHAEPITFGLKIANWFSENQRNIARFREAAAQMAVGKISGAVGNASHLGPEMEERICKRLGLSVVPVASQVIQRDRQAQSRHLRTNLRPRAPRAFEHARRVRKRRLVARARHFPQLRRTRHPSRFHDSRGLHAFENDRHHRPDARFPRAHDAKPRIHARPRLLGTVAAGPGGEGHAPG